MFLSMGLRPVLVCSALLALVQAAPAQVKIAVVGMQQAVYATAEVKKADADLQVKLKPEADRAQKLQTDLQSIQQQLQSPSAKLTDQQQEDLNTEGIAVRSASWSASRRSCRRRPMARARIFFPNAPSA